MGNWSGRGDSFISFSCIFSLFKTQVGHQIKRDGVGVMRNLAEHFPHFKVKTAGFHFSCGLVCAWWCHLLAWLRISKLRWNHTQLAVLKKKYCFDILMINLSQILLRFWTFSGFPCCVTTCLFYPCQAVQQHSRLLRSSLWSVSTQLTLVS